MDEYIEKHLYDVLLSKRLRVTLRVGQNRILKIDPDFLWTLIINHIPVLKGGMIGILEK